MDSRNKKVQVRTDDDNDAIIKQFEKVKIEDEVSLLSFEFDEYLSDEETIEQELGGNNPSDEEDEFVMVPSSMPLKSRPFSRFFEDTQASNQIASSFHKVIFVNKFSASKKTYSSHFFKFNPEGSLMSELEAAICGFYGLIAPRQVPTARPIYNDVRKFIGVLSKAVAGFQSHLNVPINEKDLYIEALAKKHYSIYELELLSRKIYKNKMDLEKLPADKIIHWKEVEEYSFDKKTKIKKTIGLSAQSMINYQKVSGITIGLMASLINKEYDCHQGNISCYGVRIDFDMSFWDLLCHLKETGLIDYAIHFPSEFAFIVTAYDIIHFPNIKDCNPYHWPTIISLLTGIFSRNAFRSEDKKVYEQLEFHEVCIYHKFLLALKYVLTNAEMYREIATLYIREDAEYKGKKIIDILYEAQIQRIAAYKKALSDTPQFYDFLLTHSREMMELIEDDFEERNKYVRSKSANIADYEKLHISIEHVRKEYKLFFNELKEKNEREKVHPFGPAESILFKSNVAY